MGTKPDVEQEDVRRRLLKQKLGQLFAWTRPEICPAPGPVDPTAFDAFDARRKALVTACESFLAAYSDEQIAAIAAGTKDAEDHLAEWRAFQDEEIHRLINRIPLWYAGGFGHPEHKADYEHWARMPWFSVEELLCLSVGVEPEEFPRDALTTHLDRRTARQKRSSEGGGSAKPLQPIEFLLRRYEQLQRQFDPSKHNWKTDPKEFLYWVDKVEFEVFPEFLDRLRQYHGTAKTAPAGTTDRTDQREIDTISKLLTAVAMDAYGFRPGQPRSPIPREIADITARYGIQVSDETVRKYLRRGAELLPPEALRD